MSGDSEEFRCSRCGKSCGKASSLRRHGYYCRSRPVGRPTSRKRCCEACTRAKIRCDTTLPACSSCSSRGIECRYDEAARLNLARRSNNTYEDNDILNDVRVAEAMFDGTRSSLDMASTTTSMDDPLDLSFLSTVPLASNLDMMSSMDVMSSGFDTANIFGESGIPTPPSPTYLPYKSPKVLYPRMAASPRQQMAMVMVRNVLESYPHMMMRKETFPPFINARCHDYTVGAEDIPEALKDCMGLAHMFATRTPESSNMIWRSIRMEQEKLLAQYDTYTTHELQAGVQALMIYIMMRLQDQRIEYEDLEVPLLHTLRILSAATAERAGDLAPRDAVLPDGQGWQEWLLRESRRRIVTTARVMNLAFSIDHALTPECFEYFLLNPLPVKKVLWEAKNEKQWRHEYDESHGQPSFHRLTNKGDIISVYHGPYGMETRDVTWQEWYSTQDGSGILIYLASQILA